MKFSDAMRLGSLLRPQAFGGYFINGKTCAIGAAYEAIGVPINALLPLPVQYWPWLKKESHCPAQGCPCHGRTECVVAHLNDDHNWTRSAIADFVATIEPAESPVLVPVPVIASALGGEG